MKLSIEFLTLGSIIKSYGQFGFDEIYKLAEETIEKGGSIEITMEYENAPKEVLRTITSIDEAKQFFRQE